MALGTFIRVWEDDDGTIMVGAEEGARMDAAVSHYLDTGRDSLLHMTTLAGDQYVTLASRITSWLVCSPAGRRRATEHEKLAHDEAADLRAEFKLPADDEETPEWL